MSAPSQWQLWSGEFYSSAASTCYPLSLLLALLLLSPSLSFLPPPPSAAPSVFLGWGCPPCNLSLCPEPQCNESLQYADGCGCCALCARLEGDRCGGRGEVGGRCNETELRCAYRLGSVYGEDRLGVCEPRRCQRKSCGYRQRCKVVARDDGGTRKVCTCDHILCDHKLNPVCGQDGHSYQSVCHLWQAECLSGQPIGILHFNHCEVLLPDHPAPPPLQCIHEDTLYSPFYIHPPTTFNPCTYHVCSNYGHMEQHPVPGCEGNPPEPDWSVDEVVVPAAWSEWSPYSLCVGNCQEGGWANRTRTCTNPPPSPNPEADPSVLHCEGESEEAKLCAPRGCRMCNFTNWMPWSTCSTVELCKQGVRTRRRNLTSTPPVPELCQERTQNKTCQFLHCPDCTPQTTAPFRLVNSSGCYSLRAITADLCGGSCGYNKCCRGVFKKKNVHYITVTIECPHRPYQPLNRYFEVPSRCVCKWCIAPYTVPGFMGENWRIVY